MLRTLDFTNDTIDTLDCEGRNLLLQFGKVIEGKVLEEIHSAENTA